MPDSDLSDTHPNLSMGETQPHTTQSGGKRSLPRFLPFLLVVVLVAIGLLAGYSSGMGVRYSTENTLLNSQLADQFRLGQQAATAGNYAVAKQHFEFIINKNPNFPGVQAAYTDLMLKMAVTPTLAFTLTPSITATPDTRSQEDQFTNAQNLLKSGDWNGALAALDSLRKLAPTYNTAQVDGMYYTALYERGWHEIRPGDCHNTNLNGGINDFTQAEHFGPLDNEAIGLRIYSRLYIAGASFWDQDWKQAQDLFSQVKDAYPTLWDSSCTTATERWRVATLHVAEDLLNAGDSCGAWDQFQAAFSVNSPDNDNYGGDADRARQDCENSQNPAPNIVPTETPTGPVETPTETPTSGG